MKDSVFLDLKSMFVLGRVKPFNNLCYCRKKVGFVSSKTVPNLKYKLLCHSVAKCYKTHPFLSPLRDFQ